MFFFTSVPEMKGDLLQPIQALSSFENSKRWASYDSDPNQGDALAHEAFACTNDNSYIQYEQQLRTTLILFEMAQVLHGLKDLN